MFANFLSKRCFISEQKYHTDETDEFLRRFQSLNKFKLEYFGPNRSLGLEATILDLLRYYEKHKTDIDTDKSYPILVDDLPDICFQENIENEGVISEVFKTINALRPTTTPQLILFFLFQSCSYKANSPEAIKKCKDENRLVFCSSLSYFLHHAQKQRITLNCRQLIKVVPEAFTTELYSKYLFFSDSRCVLILTQWGLRFHTGSAVHPIFLNVAQQLLWYIRAPISNHEDPFVKVLQKSYFRGFLRFRSNLHLLLQATNNPQKVVFELPSIVATNFPESSIEDIRVRLKYMFPELKFEFRAPATLQHICRWKIRESLLSNWNLPYGVWNLPLPRYLKKFLNLSNE